MPSIDDYFAAGVKRLISGGGWGKQAELARAMGVDKAYCNQMIHGHRRITDKWKEKMSDFFGRDVMDILQMGKAYLDENAKFPWIGEAARIEDKWDRAQFMFEQILRWGGFEHEELVAQYRTALDLYRKGEIGDDDYARSLFNLMEKVMK